MSDGLERVEFDCFKKRVLQKGFVIVIGRRVIVILEEERSNINVIYRLKNLYFSWVNIGHLLTGKRMSNSLFLYFNESDHWKSPFQCAGAFYGHNVLQPAPQGLSHTKNIYFLSCEAGSWILEIEINVFPE